MPRSSKPAVYRHPINKAMFEDAPLGAAAETDIEAVQNRELLDGNTQILKRVEGLEKQILDLEKSILAAIEARSGGGATA